MIWYDYGRVVRKPHVEHNWPFIYLTSTSIKSVYKTGNLHLIKHKKSKKQKKTSKNIHVSWFNANTTYAFDEKFSEYRPSKQVLQYSFFFRFSFLRIFRWSVTIGGLC